MENIEMKYEVRYLVNGEEKTTYLEATSAAAASETVRSHESGDQENFELIQVQLAEEAPETPQNV